MRSSVRQVVFAPYAAAAAAAARALFARMSVQPDDARKNLIYTTIRKGMRIGSWQKRDVLHVTAAHDAQAARLDWKNLGGAGAFDALVVAGTIGPVFTIDRGYANISNTDYLNAVYAPATHGVQLTLNSAHLAAWSRTSGASALTTFETGISNNLGIACRTNADNAAMRINDGTNFSTANADGSGFFMATRSASNLRRLFRNGVQLGANSATVSTATSATAVKIGGATTGVNREWAMQSCGADLSAEAAADYAIWLAYMTAVGAA